MQSLFSHSCDIPIASFIMERPSRKLANSASDRPGLVGVLSTKNYQVIYEPFEVLEKTSVRVET